MTNLSRILNASAIAVALLFLLGMPMQAKTSPDKNPKKGLRLLYWNIQNGMWAGQGDNYDAFVKWVKAQKPDVCVWCEGSTLYYTETAKGMKAEERYLPDHWGELAARYGHKYWYKAAHRDGYPQVITSKYPIENIDRLVGNKDTLVCHGAGWATIEVNKRKINIVTLHLWPMSYYYNAKDREASAAQYGGCAFRRAEMEYIYQHTLGRVPGGEKDLWMMMGDFNSISPLDNDTKYHSTLDDPRFWVHHYVLGQTPYIDVIARQYPNQFVSSVGSGGGRIDFVYCTPSLYDRVVNARIIDDDYTHSVRDPQNLSNFWWPSDHLPILVNFEMK